MIIQHNLSADIANRQYNINNTNVSKNAEKLASGYRINRAADNTAGLSISEKMRSQVYGLHRASDNGMDGISLLRTADGGINESQAIIHRLRELSVQAANDTNTSGDRDNIQAEVDALIEEVERVANDTEFNTIKILNGTCDETVGNLLNLQIGANTEQSMSVNIADCRVQALGLVDLSVLSHEEATESIDKCDRALDKLSANRTQIGAYTNRLEYAVKNDDNAEENMQVSESTIRDTDMATEMTQYSKNNILSQASQSMLAQAMGINESALQLLQ